MKMHNFNFCVFIQHYIVCLHFTSRCPGQSNRKWQLPDYDTRLRFICDLGWVWYKNHSHHRPWDMIWETSEFQNKFWKYNFKIIIKFLKYKSKRGCAVRSRGVRENGWENIYFPLMPFEVRGSICSIMCTGCFKFQATFEMPKYHLKVDQLTIISSWCELKVCMCNVFWIP